MERADQMSEHEQHHEVPGAPGVPEAPGTPGGPSSEQAGSGAAGVVETAEQAAEADGADELPDDHVVPDPHDRSGARALFFELRELPEGSPEKAELRNRLVRMHLPLVEHLARRFRNRGERRDHRPDQVGRPVRPGPRGRVLDLRDAHGRR